MVQYYEKSGRKARSREQAVQDMFDNCIPEPNTGCLLWLGGLRGRYPSVMICGRRWRGHRYVCEMVHGTMKPGDVATHSCDVTICLEPTHIRPATQAFNVQESILRSRRK